MKHVHVKSLHKLKAARKLAALILLVVLTYILFLLYFTNHFFFNTSINGVDVSLKAHGDAADTIRSFIKAYELQLLERNGERETIKGEDIGLEYNEEISVSELRSIQKPTSWIRSLLKRQNHCINGLVTYNTEFLEDKINKLNCLNKAIVEPRNVDFVYTDGSYEVVKEVYGNKIDPDKLTLSITSCISKGKAVLDLDKSHCYENPRYTLNSDKTQKTKNILNKCISTRITYVFGSSREVVDKTLINHWLRVDENLDVVIDKKAAKDYMKKLGTKYDTVGIARKFKTSVNKVVEVRGGFYGWKIYSAAETNALLRHIELGDVLEKEPKYAQRALHRDENDIGSTYVEINLTRQHLWFYKEGRLIAQGAIVSGNPNRGYATRTGTYMLNYKQSGSTLRGPGYEAEVTYWMPFNGNIGIHDASWRSSFGGSIYRRRGSHGCVNIPLYLAKRIFDNIEEGTPVICYEE